MFGLALIAGFEPLAGKFSLHIYFDTALLKRFIENRHR
jgi:hypothetical protein